MRIAADYVSLCVCITVAKSRRRRRILQKNLNIYFAFSKQRHWMHQMTHTTRLVWMKCNEYGHSGKNAVAKHVTKLRFDVGATKFCNRCWNNNTKVFASRRRRRQQTKEQSKVFSRCHKSKYSWTELQRETGIKKQPRPNTNTEFFYFST